MLRLRFLRIRSNEIINDSEFSLSSLFEQQQQVENEPVSHLFFRNEASGSDRTRRAAGIKFGRRAAFTSALTRVPPCDTRQMSTSRRRHAEKKTKRESKILFLRSFPSPPRRRYPCKSMIG